MLKRIIKGKWAYFFILPWFTLFAAFIFFPFIMGFVVSMQRYDFVTSKFIFLDNFIALFKSDLFYKSLYATIRIAVILIPCTLIFSLWVANTIAKTRKGFQSFVKASFYIPAVSSSVALAVTWKWIFNPAYGLSAYLCSVAGIPSISWFETSGTAVLIVSICVLACVIGQPIILYSAAIGGIPVTYYEAADIDGATEWNKFFKITFPLLKPTTLFILITTTISSLQVFEVPYLLTAGGPLYGTTTILYQLFKTAFEYMQYGLAASLGVILFIIIASVSALQFKFLNSDVQY